MKNLSKLAFSGLVVSWLLVLACFFIVNGLIWGLIPSHYTFESLLSCMALCFVVALWFVIMSRKKTVFCGVLSGVSLALLWCGGMLFLWGDLDIILISKYIYSSLVLFITLSLMMFFYYFTKSNGTISP